MKKYILLILAFLLSFNSYAQTTNGGVRFVGATVVMQLDDDARNIIRTIENERVAGGGAVFTLAERTYVNYIVTNFKAIGVWSKITALYGFVGGTAASHKWNWKDMRDLDAAFRLTYSGTITHSANGIQGNGTSGFARTFFIPSSNLTIGNTHLSIYSRTQNLENSVEIGSFSGDGSTQSFRLSTFFNTLNGAVYDDLGGTSNRLIATGYNSKGYFIGTRNSSSQKIFRDGLQIGSRTASGGTLSTEPLSILGFRSTTTTFSFSSKQISFATIGSGLTDTEAIRMSNIVTFAQGILNRQ